MFNDDDDLFPIKCPDCKHEFHEKIGRMKAGGAVRCPDSACNLEIGLRAEQFSRELEIARKSPKDYYRQFLHLRLPD
jgi:hypothetical protein